MRLLLASSNAHKVDEIRSLLHGTGLEVVSLRELDAGPDPEETGITFEDNALLKARTLHDRVGGAVLADDSGLEVDALGGAPGVWSKRFSPDATDTANNTLLLQRLDGHADRRARFRCVLALVTDTFEGTVDGACEGTIAHAPRGAQGFGYDPLFLADALPGRTLAEATPAEKNAVSHRGHAVRRLPELLAQAGLVPLPGLRA